MAYEVKVEKFEGPLDLLLHLIKKNEMDIYDIPMAEITAQYLATLDAMKNLNLDVAGEFLLMAATLTHIKSRMLLPVVPDEEVEPDEEDPRAELVRRLLEYQRYKEAALDLDALPLLGRDTFPRGFVPPTADEADGEELQPVGLYELVEALRGLLREAPDERFHEVAGEGLSVTERVNEVLVLLSGRESVAFQELFASRPRRDEIVVTLLALLELGKLRLVRLLQDTRYGAIWIRPAVLENAAGPVRLEEEALGYG